MNQEGEKKFTKEHKICKNEDLKQLDFFIKNNNYNSINYYNNIKNKILNKKFLNS